MNENAQISKEQFKEQFEFFKDQCHKIDEKLAECMKFNNEKQILCGEIYNASKKCKMNLDKLKKNI